MRPVANGASFSFVASPSLLLPHLPHLLCHSQVGCEHTHTHTQTHTHTHTHTDTHTRSPQKCPAMLKDTRVVRALSSTHFCPPLWGMQTNTQTTTVMSWHDVWGSASVSSSFSCLFLCVYRSVCGAALVQHTHTHTTQYEDTIGRQPRFQGRFIWPRVWSKPLCACMLYCMWHEIFGLFDTDMWKVWFLY